MNETEDWIEVGTTAEFAIGSARAVRVAGRQIAVVHTDADEWFAIDNLCPHEGYPLVQGDVRDGLLTCAWHNYKFDLRNGGRCVQGDEDVPSHAIRVDPTTDRVSIALARTETDRARRLESLEAGLRDGNLGRLARDAVRLLRAGADLAEVAADVAVWDARHAEWGATHALPTAAELAAWLGRRSDDDVVVPLVALLELTSEPNVRREPHPHVDPTTVDPRAFESTFAHAIETEDGTTAEALLRGALSHPGLGPPAIERGLLLANTRHFLGFGHGLIYTLAAFDLIALGPGPVAAADLLAGVLRRIVAQTREDTLPPMAHVVEQLEQHASDWSTWRRQESPVVDPGALRAALLDGTRHEAVAAVVSAFADDGSGPGAIVDAVLDAASERMLRFDIDHELGIDVQEGWLDVTHALTFAHAVQRTLPRLPDAAAVRLVFWAAHFVNRTHPLDRDHPPPFDHGADPEALTAAIRAREADRAAAIAPSIVAGLAGTDEAVAALESELLTLALDDRYVRPIYVAHAVKTTRAAFAVFRRTGRANVVAAAIRFLASPVREAGVRRSAGEALRFVGDGKPPRRLTS